MGSIDELKVRQLLEKCKFYWENKDYDQTYTSLYRQCVEDVSLLLSSDLRSIPDRFSLQTLVLFAETVGVDPAYADTAERFLLLFLQYPQAQDQFFVRSQLALAILEAAKVNRRKIKGQEAIDQVKKAYSYIQKALEVILKPENKPKYQFLIYNLSVAAWKVLRPMLKSGFLKQFGECFEKLYALLEEMDDPDVSWRVRVMQALVNCYLDADKKPEAQKMCDKIWDVTKRKGAVAYQEALWRLRVHIVKENAGAVGSIRKEAEQQKGDLKFHVTLQQIKSGGLPEAQVEKELMAILTAGPGADAMAETGRVALQYNLINVAKQVLTNFPAIRQPTLRARVWIEYSKAEILVRESSLPIDSKTGMKKSVFEIKRQEFSNRIEALKILDRSMVANKRLADPDVTTEGCILIWNICKPVLTASGRGQVYKPLQVASSYLEELESPLHELRILIYLELAKYELHEGFIAKADANIEKGFLLDSSILLQKSTVALQEDEDPAILQRPLDRYLSLIHSKLRLKKNIYKDPDTALDQAIADLEAARPLEASNAKENILRRALTNILNAERHPTPRPADLVEEEEAEYALKDSYRFRNELKTRHLLASQLAAEAFQFGYDDIAFSACEFTFTETWDPFKDIDQVAAQASTHFTQAQLHGNALFSKGYEIGYKNPVKFDEDVTNPSLIEVGGEEEKSDFEELERLKTAVLTEISEGVTLATSIKQAWLVMNGGTILWNLYLPALRVPDFDLYIFPAAYDTFKLVFDALLGFIEKQALVANPGALSSLNRITDLNFPKKMQVLCSLAVVVLRLELSQGQPDSVMRIAEGLLLKTIPPQYRKEVESIRGKALTLKITGGGGAGGGKGGTGKVVDSGTSEILSLLESAKVFGQEASKRALCLEALKKSFTLLSNWKPQEDEEGDLQIHAEIWTKLGRQAIKFPELTKLALVSAERSLQFKAKGQIPVVRQRWYSVAEHLYGEALVALINPQKQEQGSQEFLVHSALERFVSAARYGLDVENADLVTAPARAMFNAAIQVKNQQMLLEPMSTMAEMLVRLKDRSDLDFLVIFYKVLLDSVTASEAWEQGESIVEAGMSLLPASHQKILWESQMLYLSKQGKNVIGYIGRMKENNPLMQAKLWLKLARSSTNETEVKRAFSTAVDILRQDINVELSEVLVEWATWLHSKGEPIAEILMSARDVLLDIEGQDEEDEEPVGPSNASSSSRRSSLKPSSKQGSVHSRKSITSKSKNSKQSSGAKSRSRKSVSKKGKSRQSRLASREAVDTHPEQMNATHLERLVRIQVMLSEVAPTTHSRKECLLLGHYFLTALLEMSLKTYNLANLEHVQEIPQDLEQWAEFETPQVVLDFFLTLEERTALTAFAFEKPKVTHELVWTLASSLDEDCGLYQHALVVLEFLRVYCIVVEKRKDWLPLYSSWKARLLTRLGGDQILPPLPYDGLSDPDLQFRVGTELLKRDSIIEAISCLQQNSNPLSYAFLAQCYALQGEMKEALSWHRKALEIKEVSVMTETVPRLLRHLSAVKKFEEAKQIFLKVVEVLQNCPHTSVLRTKELCARLYLVFGELNLVESMSQYRRKDECQRMKVAAKQCYENFRYLVQKEGCSLPTIQAFIDMDAAWVRTLIASLRKRKTKKSAGKKAETLEELRIGLRLCYDAVCAFGQQNGPKGASYYLAQVLRKFAELGILEEQLKRSIVLQPVAASGEDVSSRYLEDLNKQIDEAREQWAEKPSRAEKALSKLISGLQILAPNSALAKMMSADEVVCRELVGGEFNLERAKEMLPELISAKELTLLSNVAVLQRLAETGLRLETESEAKVKYLNIYQYAAAKIHLSATLTQCAPSIFKDGLLLNLYDYPSLAYLASAKPSPFQVTLEQKLASSFAFKTLHLNTPWSDMKSVLSPGSSVLTIQLTPDSSKIYLSFLCIYKDKSTGSYFSERNLESEDRTLITDLIESVGKLKLSLQRTPLNVLEDVERLMQQSEQSANEIKEKMEKMMAWVKPALSGLISPELPFEPKPPEEVTAATKKKPAAAQKKEDKQEIQIPLPNSGLSTLVLCLDSRLSTLPFEALPWLGCIPIVTQDFSLANYCYRLASLGAKEDANSVFPLAKDSSKFLIEPSLEPSASEKSREINEKLLKLKWESCPVASSGLWQRLCGKAACFLHYTHMGVLDADVSVLSSQGCARLVVMADKFTSLKKYIPGLPANHSYYELFTLAGAACIVQNVWAVQPLEAARFCEGLVDSLAAGQTVGVGMYGWRNQAQGLLTRTSFRSYGVPLIKI